MKIKILLEVAIVVFLLFNLQAQPYEISADNGILEIKLDLIRGGAISYISLSSSDRNLVNVHNSGGNIKRRKSEF